MLASRVLKVAEDFLADYKELKVGELLQLSLQCANRQLQAPQFASLSQQVKTGGENITAQTRLKNYPQQMRTYLQRSDFRAALPENIGRFLADGFRGDETSTPYSPEVQQLVTAYNACVTDLSNLVASLRKLGTTPLLIPADHIAIDFVVPREAVANDTRQLLALQEVFCDLVKDVNEYLGVGELSPPLVYTSTTDPVLAIAAYAGTAYTIVKLFTGVLRAAKEAVQLYNAIAIIRNQAAMKDAVGMMMETAQATIKSQVETEVRQQLSGLVPKVDEGRQNELTVAINLKTTSLVPRIAEGVSIGISVESLDKVRTLVVPELQADQLSFAAVAEDARNLEIDTRAAITSSGGASVLRLSHKPPE